MEEEVSSFCVMVFFLYRSLEVGFWVLVLLYIHEMKEGTLSDEG